MSNSIKYIGGLRFDWINITYPFGGLILDDNGMSIGWNFMGIKKLKRFYYYEIVSASFYKGFFSKGIFFKINSKNYIFWTNKADEILNMLKTKQVPVINNK